MLKVKNILKTLVSQDSTRNNELAIAEFLEGYLSGLGIQVKRLKLRNGRFNVYGYRNPTKTSVLWYGHIDTVPAYENWSTDPFKLKEKNGRYYGLGVCDMKGGIAALLTAVSKLDPAVPVRLLFCADEEYDSEGAWEAYNKYPDIFSGVESIVSMEPGASKAKIGGADVLTLGRRGRVRLIVKVHGVSAHGAHPDRGVNATDIAVDLSKEFRNMKLTEHPLLGPATHFVASFNSQTEGLSLPEYAEFEIDRHLVVPDTTKTSLKEYQVIADNYLLKLKSMLSIELASKVSVSVEIKKRDNEYMLPFLTERDNSFVKKVEKILLEVKPSVTFNYGKSVGDENVFSQIKGVHPIILGPEGGDIHAPNEWVSIKSLDECVKVYSKILLSQDVKN